MVINPSYPLFKQKKKGERRREKMIKLNLFP